MAACWVGFWFDSARGHNFITLDTLGAGSSTRLFRTTDPLHLGGRIEAVSDTDQGYEGPASLPTILNIVVKFGACTGKRKVGKMELLMFLRLKSTKPLAENFDRSHKWDNASIPADFSYSGKIQQVTDLNNVECLRLGKAMTGYDVIRFITEPITWG